MSTAKSRINVSVSTEVNTLLKKLARRDQVPTATKAERLLELALEIEEDEVWDKIASERDNGDRTRFIPHNEVWK
ncbi:MAG: hypothetical protein KBB55_03980 [Candidatus Buchananbacteria bacterium]|nr:hypothetical protein [Candidatus Buchananbacteria bacterium]